MGSEDGISGRGLRMGSGDGIFGGWDLRMGSEDGISGDHLV